MTRKEKNSVKRVTDVLNRAKEEDLIVLIFNDTETTGTSFEDRIIQSAHSVCLIDRDFNLDKLEFIYYIEEYVCPPLSIKPDAAAVHGIWEDDIFNIKVKKWELSISNIELLMFSESKYAYYVAHNSVFDLTMLKKEGIFWERTRVIDTLLIARFVFKDESDIKSKQLQYLRYFFNFDKKEDFKSLVKDHKVRKLVAHTALSDIIVLIYLFKYFLKINLLKNVNHAVLLSSKPLIIDKVMNGKKFEKNSSLYNAICSREPNGLSYFNWAMINMTNLSIIDKLSISHFTIQAFRDKAISIERLNEATPMIHVVACFISEHWEYLSSIGYNLNALRHNSLMKIEINIKELENSSNLEEKTLGLEKRNELNFLNNFIDNFPNNSIV